MVLMALFAKSRHTFMQLQNLLFNKQSWTLPKQPCESNSLSVLMDHSRVSYTVAQ